MAKKTKARKITDGSPARWDQSTYDMRAGVGGQAIVVKKRAKKYRAVVFLSTFVLAPLALLLAIGVSAIYIQGSSNESPVERSVDSPTKATANNAMTTWLSSKPAPLPGGTLVSWDGVISAVEPAEVEENGETVEQPGLETHQFTVRASSGQLFHSTVQVTWTEALGSRVVGAPSLEPLMRENEATAVDMVEVWPNHTLATAPDGIVPAVDVWLQAYTSGNSNKLRLAMKDPTSEHNYFPLTQVAQASVGEVTHFAPNPENPAEGLARVTVNIVWDGTPVDTNEQEFIGGATIQTYDLLLEDTDTASPTVVAWGGAGTGQDLTPFKNAFEGRAVDLKTSPFFSEEDVQRRMKESIDQYNKSMGEKNSAMAPRKEAE
ncbi:hypothetical protein ACT3TP_15845 [Glutamicibacter sp. AOP38-B1-38]|uniref:hypothetical protein n=1 Tax=Glutamicibacter sp. AOP38-B1-38 TaxID=3457680 RepID=UPI004033DB84